MSSARIKKADTAPGRPPAWYFVVVADNGEPVATSEPYTRKADAERGVTDLAEIIVSDDFGIELEADE